MDRRRIYVLARFFILIFFLIVLYFGLKYAIYLLYPFFIALGLSFLLLPFVSFLQEKWKIPRTIATLLMILIMFIALFGTVFLIITELIHGTAFLAEKVPEHFQSFIRIINQLISERVLPYYEKITSFFKTLHPSQQQVIYQYIDQLMGQIEATGGHVLQIFFSAVPRMLSLLPLSMTVTVFIVLATFLMTKDMPHIRMRLRNIIPVTARTSSIDVLKQFRKLLGSYVKAQITIITITAMIILIGLYIIQIKHALTIALFSALVDLLPFIGTGIIFVPWIIYLFLTGSYSLTIKLSILYMVIIIVRQFIEPKIVSDHIGVPPLMTLIVMFAGFQMWGLFGIIAAPFILVLFNALKRAGVIEQIVHFVKG